MAHFFQANNIDLDRYDHVTCIISLNDVTEYWGLGGTLYENGTRAQFNVDRSGAVVFA